MALHPTYPCSPLSQMSTVQRREPWAGGECLAPWPRLCRDPRDLSQSLLLGWVSSWLVKGLA